MTRPELPGADLIEQGLDDLSGGRETIPSLLVSIGAPRLVRLGFVLPDPLFATPEHRLYALLAESDSDSAHSRYNALIRRLVSFERAAEALQDANQSPPDEIRLVDPEDLVEPEWVEWYGLTPAARWEASGQMWATYLTLGGRLDPEPDTQSPFGDPDDWRGVPADGGAGLRLVRRSGV